MKIRTLLLAVTILCVAKPGLAQRICRDTSGTVIPCQSGNAVGYGVFADIIASSNVASGVAPTRSAATEKTKIVVAAKANVYNVYAANMSGTAGYLMSFNSATVPSDGTVSPYECVPIAANSFASIERLLTTYYDTGVVVAVSTGADCNTLTTSGSLTAWFRVQYKAVTP